MAHAPNRSAKANRVKWHARHKETRTQFAAERQKLRNQTRKLKLSLRKDKHIQLEELKKQQRIENYKNKDDSQ